MGRSAEGFRVRWPGGGTVASVRFTWQGERYELGLGNHATPGGARDLGSAQAAAAEEYAKVVSGRRLRRSESGLVAPQPLDVSIALWTEAMKGVYDAETVKTWVVYGRTWVAFFGDWLRVHEAGIGDYTRARLRQVLRATVQKERSALRNFLEYCREQRWLAEVPAFPELAKRTTGVRSGPQRAKPVPVTETQVMRFLEALPEMSDKKPFFPVRAYFEVLWETGLRPATVQGLSVPEHFVRGGRTLTITDEIDKSRFGREIDLTDRARRALTRVAPTSGLIFGRHNWSKQLAKAAEKAGMPKGFARYDLRHGRATDLLEKTGDNLLGVGYVLGHKRPTTTDRYLKAARRHGGAVIAEANRGFSGDRPTARRGNRGDRRGSNPRQLEPQGSPLHEFLGDLLIREAAEGREKSLSSGHSGDHPQNLQRRLETLEQLLAEWDLLDAFSLEIGDVDDEEGTGT